MPAKLSLATVGAALASLALAATVGLTAASAADASVAPAPAAHASVVPASAPIGPLFFHLNNDKSALCMSVASNHGAVQAKCILDTNPHQAQVPPDQAWGFPSAGGGWVLAENLNKQCLGISGSSKKAGARVVAEACKKQASEEWKVDVVKNSFPFVYAFINRNSGLSLDIASASTKSGAAVVQEKYVGHSDQKWFQDIVVNV